MVGVATGGGGSGGHRGGRSVRGEGNWVGGSCACAGWSGDIWIHSSKGQLLSGVIHAPCSPLPNTEVRGSELFFVSGRAS